MTLQEFCTVCALGELDEAERIFKREPLCLQVKAFKYVSLLLYYLLMIVVATRADEIVFHFMVRNTILDFINQLFIENLYQHHKHVCKKVPILDLNKSF